MGDRLSSSCGRDVGRKGFQLFLDLISDGAEFLQDLLFSTASSTWIRQWPVKSNHVTWKIRACPLGHL